MSLLLLPARVLSESYPVLPARVLLHARVLLLLPTLLLLLLLPLLQLHCNCCS